MNDLFRRVYSNISSIISQEETTLIQDNGGNDTYGEILPDSLDMLLSSINFSSRYNFYDLGSGLGKVVLHVALRTGARSTGFEMSKTRYQYAMNALSTISNEYPQIRQLVTFINDNLLSFDSEYLGNSPSLVFTCSTCFDKKLMKDIQEMTKRKDVDVLTLKAFENEEPTRVFTNVPMTWSKSGVTVYHYKRT